MGKSKKSSSDKKSKPAPVSTWTSWFTPSVTKPPTSSSTKSTRRRNDDSDNESDDDGINGTRSEDDDSDYEAGGNGYSNSNYRSPRQRDSGGGAGGIGFLFGYGSRADLNAKRRPASKSDSETSSKYDKRKRQLASRSASSRIMRIAELIARIVMRLLPKTNHGWGFLILSCLMMFYVLDFVFVLHNSPNSTTPLNLNLYNGHIPVNVTQPVIAENRSAMPIKVQKPITPMEYFNVDLKTALGGGDGEEKKKKEKKAASKPAGGAGTSAEKSDATVGKAGGTSVATEENKEAVPPVEKVETQARSAEEAPAADATSKNGKGKGGSSSTDSSSSSSSSSSSGVVSHDHPFNRKRDDLMVPADSGVLVKGEVAKHYKNLVLAYLDPFVSEGIPRKYFFDILKRKSYGMTPSGANKGTTCFFVQIIDSRVYMFDPHQIQKNSKPFIKSRISELLWLISRVAAKSKLGNTEFLVSTHDCIQTASAPHTYRGATFVEKNPVFTIVSCNFSDNIPFPMWEGNDDRGGAYISWDQEMERFAKDATPWDNKKNTAVFRGGNRPSMYFKEKNDAENHCDDVGRTRLLALAQANSDVLDVSVGGSCGGTHHKLSRMSPEAQHVYKYTIYAEGNCFWADRLNRDLFGPNAVIKQTTPCGQFYEPLMRPGTHFIETDFFFNDLVEKLKWANTHDVEVRKIVQAANDFGRNFLSLEGIEIYVRSLLEEYTKLLVEPVAKPEKGAEDVTVERAAM